MYIEINATTPEQLSQALDRLRRLGDVIDRFSRTCVNFEPIDDEYYDKATAILDEMEVPYRNV